MRKSAYGFLFRRKIVPEHSEGFTLIELLIVITVVAIIGIYTLANYRSFGEDQNLKSAVLDIQSQLRTAQANATANVKCSTQFSATWQVEYTSDKKTINLKCQEPPPSPLPVTKKTFTLGANIEISSVTGSFCPGLPPPAFTISFAPINGKISLGSDTRCSQLTITLKNTKTNSTKSFIIEQGGRIYAL